MRRAWSVVLVAALLAGCASDGSKDADALEDAAAALDVDATDTTGVIRGVVVDMAIAPVGNATVTIAALNRTATTTDLGAFGFEGLEPGTYFLSASHPDYTTVQQSVEVQAGVQEPDIVRIQVASVARGDPLVVAYQATIFVDSSIVVLGTGYTLGGVTTDHSYWFEVAIDPNATVAQTEVTWQQATALAENANVYCGTYTGGDDIDDASQQGPSPLVFRANATKGADTADSVYCQVFANDSAGLPGGVLTNQQFDCYVHVFYNFLPDPDWQFGRDGEYPVPSR